jgi:putative transposase
VLNYIATSNHIHLLVLDRGQGEIAPGMQLIAGRTAQEHNRRKNRAGAFRQDRYHATAVDTEGYPARRLVSIDLNRVRAGAVTHPGERSVCGYRELQNPPIRYRSIDTRVLADLLQIRRQSELRQAHAEWVEAALREGGSQRDEAWSESLAVGSRDFVAGVQSELGISAAHRTISEIGGDHYRLHEPTADYAVNFRPKKSGLSAENTIPLEDFYGISDTYGGPTR